ncbi:hypothetical protein BDV30DRAFT_53472 [Aspergillus minisclerotigenes]|uniref:Uncharacterized protein n=1 Tax=Aspergillus minisclerotigenes TaxID=656917 RepID=A0A5N6JAH2_9EURO|nr:hypothetical protein BDV30DRAFT_53472 [Aspergillus minisclerotigenes]
MGSHKTGRAGGLQRGAWIVDIEKMRDAIGNHLISGPEEMIFWIVQELPLHCSSIVACTRADAAYFMIEEARCSSLPFFSMSQNLDGELASPGKRHAKPTTAIGTSTVVCAEGILMSENSLFTALCLYKGTNRTEDRTKIHYTCEGSGSLIIMSFTKRYVRRRTKLDEESAVRLRRENEKCWP